MGTTVRSTHFFEHVPVRKQTAIKNSTKCLAKIHRLMQTYAMARPAVRFRLHVVKAKNNKSDFIYAPKPNPDVEDAVMKTFGKDCALQCHRKVLKVNDFEINAFLPKPSADASKIVNRGAFISIDSRPVSNRGGLIKQVIRLFQDRLRKSNPSFMNIKDPFCCMNILCPPDSYDPNIEPAKDDMMFDNSEVVLEAVKELLQLSFPENGCGEIDSETTISTHQISSASVDEMQHEKSKSALADQTIDNNTTKSLLHPPDSRQPYWRSSMYGIDEDDLQSLQGIPPPRVEEEENDIQDVTVSNPWTIARMNTTIKPKLTVSNGQLLSPAKSFAGNRTRPSSPISTGSPRQTIPREPSTPQTSAKTSNQCSDLDREPTRSIQRLPQPSIKGTDFINSFKEAPDDRLAGRVESVFESASTALPQGNRAFMSSPLPLDTRCGMARQDIHLVQSQIPSKEGLRNYPVDPLRHTQSSPIHRPPQGKKRAVPPLALVNTRKHPESAFVAPEPLNESQLGLRDNTDIRDFFRTRARASPGDTVVSSFTPIKVPHYLSQPNLTRYDVTSRPSSAEPQPRSKYVREQTRSQLNSCDNADELEMASKFREYAELERPGHAGGALPSNFVEGPTNMTTALRLFRHNQLSENTHTANNHVRSYEDPGPSSPSQVQQVVRGYEPNILLHKQVKIQPQRRRTTDGLQRSSSSMLPLETTPHGCHTHDLVLLLPTNVIAIRNELHHLNMRFNRTNWGSSPPKIYGGFIESMSEKTIVTWVTELDDMLHEQHGRLPMSNTRSSLHEGIQRALNMRKESQDVGVVEPNSQPETITQMPIVNEVDKNEQNPETVDELEKQEVGEFDMSQFIAFDVDEMEEGGEETKSSVDGEFNEGIEDDMLMDM